MSLNEDPVLKYLFFSCFNKNSGGNVYGGAEKSITNLANWFSEKQNSKVVLNSVESSVLPFKIGPNVSFVGNNLSLKNKVLRHVKIFLHVRKSLKEYNPDVIVSFWIQPLFYTLLARPFSKKKIYYSERNDPRLEYGVIARLMRWFVMFFCKGVVFQTRDALNYFPPRVKNKSVVIHNPVYIKEEDYPLKKMDNRIVAVGRLNQQKNYFLLLDAFSEVSKKYPNIVLEIYGEGILRRELSSYILKLGLERRAFLMGAVDNVIDLVYGARLFVMTSLYEGMPNALMEAMALGIPVVCSDCPCGGPRELIRSGVNGLLFENNNRDDLVKKMVESLRTANISSIVFEERKILVTHACGNIFSKWNDFIK